MPNPILGFSKQTTKRRQMEAIFNPTVSKTEPQFPSKTLSASSPQAPAMASLILGAPPAPSQSLAFNSRISFSRSETLAISLPSSTASLSLSTASSPPVPSVYCGRGDKKTERGKRFNHSFGNARPRNKNKGRGPPRVPVPAAPQKKDKFEDDTIVKVEIDESLS